MIYGYKAFKKGLINKYGVEFQLDTIYSKNKDLKFGEYGHGYHIASSLADTFRFFNPVNEDNVYCEVVAFGNIVYSNSESYNDANKMFVAENMIIKKILTREDIFSYLLKSDIDEFRRFLNLYPFTKEELNYLRNFVIDKNNDYKTLLNNANNQNGDIINFKRNRKYLRKLNDLI